MSRIFICSLKHHQGLYKEIILLAKEFSKFGQTYTIISKGYKNSFNNSTTKNFFLTNGIGIKGMLIDIVNFPFDFIKLFRLTKSNSKKNFFIFYNPHPLNWIYSIFINLLIKNSQVCTVLHEPYKSTEERFKYGLPLFIYYSIVQLLQKLSIKQSHVIISMSPNGSDLFEKKFSNFKGKHIKSNLLFEKFNLNSIENKRRFFSFVGTVNKAKGIYEFIDLVNYSLTKDDNIEFCLITSSNIEKYNHLFKPGYERKLRIINKSKITDLEIFNVIKESFAIFSIHNVASQSGVLPISYGLNTPTIMRNIPAFTQYSISKDLVLPINFKAKEIYEICRKISSNKNNFVRYEKKCNQVFNKFFSKENFKKYYSVILKEM